MILDEKLLLVPPPPYCSPRLGHLFANPETEGDTASIITIGSNNPYAAYLSARPPTNCRPSFSSLPSHLLLQIVYNTIPQSDGQFERKTVLQRQTLYWLETSLRLVSHALYISCMNILRSTYLPSYDSLVRPPYSSDPFPSSGSNSAPSYRPLNSPYGSSSSFFPLHRELRTLDLFIAVLAHEELLYDTSSLHLSRHEAYKDIFDLLQPRSRLEDLVAKLGSKAGLISLGDESTVPSTPTTPQTLLEDKSEKENNPYATIIDSASLTSSPQASTSTLPPPLKKSKSAFSIFSTFSKGKGKASAVALQKAPRREATLSPIPFESLSISFSTRKIGLAYAPITPSARSKSSLTVTGSSPAYGGSTYGALGVSHNSRGRKRTILEISRQRDEALECSAEKLIKELRDWMIENPQL
ncbi:hypothetical protein BDP27DRAFT_1319744 [Rhodocollybia butyracea]|uniref:Uncharacterized protein n=1 Tax=Rhodocollybia butyracea TaxID=206335 RepID=A0A9P5UBD9_9AGAR|nr:hypothetical protein BDP27DRAFT_1319744 [Rhodocollybia butyracea]